MGGATYGQVYTVVPLKIDDLSEITDTLKALFVFKLVQPFCGSSYLEEVNLKT